MFNENNRYVNKPKKDKVVLYRILGNDLPPRHKKGQTYRNLNFTLQYEPDLRGSAKKWVVNRILDSGMERKIIKTLQKSGCDYIHIPFDAGEYRGFAQKTIEDGGITKALTTQAGKMRHNKILYITNNNTARNTILRDGKRIADWILPLDGNLCFTEAGWERIVSTLSRQTEYDRYFVVPIYRLTHNREYFNFDPAAYAEHEPQIIFGKDTKLEFNEYYRYGRNDKIELLKRIKLDGVRADRYSFKIEDAKRKCGYVVKLCSGVKNDNKEAFKRNRLREIALDRILKKADKICKSVSTNSIR